MRTLRWIKLTLKPPDRHETYDFESWRRWLVNILTILIIVMGFPLSMALVFPQFLAQGQTFLIALDVLFFLLGVWHVLRQGRTFMQHPVYWVLAVYLLTISFHIALGPQYARTGWLMLCTVVTAVLYGAPAALAAALSNIVLLMVMYFGLGPTSPAWQAVWAAPAGIWYSYVINITFLSLAVALPIGFLIARLNHALLRERRTAKELQAEIQARINAQSALQMQEQRFRMLAENASDVVWTMDLEGCFTYLSPSIERLTGYPRQRLHNSRLSDFYGPEDQARIESAITAELAKPPEERRVTATMELRQRTRSGDAIDVEVSASWITDDNGRPVGIQGITRDISQRKAAERRLRESQRILAQSLDFLPDPTFAIDTEGKILFWNRAIERLTGMAAKEMVGRGNYAYAVPFYGERRPIMIDLVGCWNAQTAEKYHNIKEQDGLLVSETVNPPFIQRESIFWNAACRLYDEDGRDLGAIETIRDITEFRRAEKAVRESEYRFRSFFNSSPEGVVLIDLAGAIQSVNKAFLTMSEYFFDELEGRRFETIVPEPYQASLLQAVQSVIEGVIEDAPLELELRKKNGRTMPIAVRGWLITDDASNPVAVGGFVKDISGEKALQQEKADLENQLIQTQKMEAVGTLAGGIAHDFNNLLGAILGYTELALAEPPAAENPLRDYLTQVLAASGKATNLVRQILRFSRREAVTLKELSLKPLLKEVLKLLQSTIPPHITIAAQFTADQDTVMADATQIQQVVMNLCTNAYHAMQPDGGVITVSLKTVHLDRPREYLAMRLPAGDYLELAVRDTGRGIPADQIDRIFEPYFTTKAAGEGTGLGLAVSLGIVKSHNGMIAVDSRPGRGTIFRVLLPPAQTAILPEALPSSDLPRGRGQHILVVDDEKYFGDVVRTHLENLGYRVSAFQSSSAAYAAYRDDPEAFAMVITDQTMPEMTGLELIRNIRSVDAAVPVIICTGFSEAVTRQILQKHNIAEYLMKPVSRADLARTVDKVLNGQLP